MSEAAAAPPTTGTATKRLHDDDHHGPTHLRLALCPLGPPDHVDAALDVLFACLARFLLDTLTTATPDDSPASLEVMVVDEATGRYAQALQTRAAALPAPAPAPAPGAHRRAVRLRLGPITTHTERTQALACACDRRLLPSPDHPASHDVFHAAGPQLASTARLLHHRAEPGRAYAIKLPATSDLRARQGVQYVILAAPPSAAATADWEALLRATYEAVLECFLREVAPKLAAAATPSSPPPAAKKAKPAAASSAAVPPPPPSAPPAVIPAYRHPGPPPQSMGWQGGLHQYLHHKAATDAALRASVFVETERYMVIYDGYPKARVHLLLLPKPAFLAVNAATDLRREHLERLAYLHAEAARIRDKLQADLASAGRTPTRIRMGYHSLPSLHPLHLHIVSQDFDAPALKTKRHWASFTTAFFLEAAAVEAAVREEGRVVVDKARAEALLKEPLRCHACGAGQTNMPTLKGHLTRCQRVKDLA